MESHDIKRSDWLALERTKMANERTFLAYFRTFVVVFSSGLAIIQIESLQHMAMLGYFLSGIAILLLIIGVTRLFLAKRRIKRYFKG